MPTQSMNSLEPKLTSEWFPELSRQRVYANHAAMSPWPAATREAVERFARENTDHPDRYYLNWLHTDKQLRALAAKLLNAQDGSDITLTNNTTEGICIVANGLDWSPGDNVVSALGEFPTNRMAWQNLESQGVELLLADLSGEDPEGALIELLNEKTRLLTISSVQWIDGLRLDLARLGSACRQRGILFFVDAIQQFGALEMDVQACEIDFLAAGSHKWQMGPEGMGIFYSHDRVRKQLKPRRIGWNMFANPYDFDQPDQLLTKSGRRFEPGSTNQMGKAALYASLSVLDGYGLPNVECRVLENTQMLTRGISAIQGLELNSASIQERQSGIVHFSVKDQSDARAFSQELQNLGVIAVARGGGIRLSPHFYQGKTNMSDLLNRTEQALNTIK